MEALSRFVVRHRRLVGLLWLGALIAGVFAASGLSGRLDQSLSMPGQKGYVANQAILKQYGNGAGREPLVPVVTLPAGSTVDDPAASAALTKAFGDVGALPGFRVASYADTRDRSFVGADGRTTFGLVYPHMTQSGFASDDVINVASQRVAALLRQDLPAGTKVDVTGTIPLEQGSSSSKSGPGVLAETLIGGIGALAVLAFVFASFLALVPLLVAAVSILTSFLVVFGLTEVMKVSSLVQFLVALIGLGVAIDYSLLLVTRWREELAHGHDNETAVHNAMATAGRAVAFSGLTVGLGLIALVLLPVPFLRSMGVGGMVIPLVSVAVTLTLVPALLSGGARRLDWPKLRHEGQAARGWTRWARLVVRRRWVAAVAAFAVLGFLGVNALNMQIGATKSTSLSQSGPAREGLDTLTAAGITSGVLTPIEVVVPRGQDATALAHRLAAVDGVHAAVAPASWTSGESSLIEVLPAQETATSASRAVVNRVRDLADSAAPGALTGGAGAFEADMVHAVYGNFPLMLTAVAIITFILLVRAFRSILLPLKAVLLNLLSVGAIYGVVTLVWQDGHGSQTIGGIPATGAVTGWIPLMIFAFLYGLSMDYEVFILARMREEYDRTGDTTAAVVEGIGRTGRLVTSAALILFLAFASLASGPEVQLKVFATGLGAGILLDATVVRALLVPALVSLFGRWNWWLPGSVAKVLRVEASPVSAAAERGREPELTVAG
ncbi:MAG: MMPL family transporter [Catenulispora sp.]|nr:MMPL family transporter [Catenulispora sp.]